MQNGCDLAENNILGHLGGVSFHYSDKKATTPGVPKRSPIQVLTRPCVVYLRWSDKNRCIQRGMVVATDIWNNNALVLENSFIQHCFTHLAIFFYFFRCILMLIFLSLSWFAFRALGSRPLSQSTFKKKLLSISYKLSDNNFFVL